MFAVLWEDTLYTGYKLIRQEVSEEEYERIRQADAEADPERWEIYLQYEKEMEEEERAKSED